MNRNMKRQCEGYCGGMMTLKNTRTTESGERFCQDCFETYLENY